MSAAQQDAWENMNGAISRCHLHNVTDGKFYYKRQGDLISMSQHVLGLGHPKYFSMGCDNLQALSRLDECVHI